MDFNFSSEIEALQKRIREFVAAEILPLESDPASYDDHENIRLDLLEPLRAKAKAAGLWAPQMPEARGGLGPQGLINLTRALAAELARHDIRVNALAPGYVETDINREFLDSDAGQALKKRIPQRRFGRAEDLEGGLLLLASDASRYMTGAVLVIDGGQSATL